MPNWYGSGSPEGKLCLLSCSVVDSSCECFSGILRSLRDSIFKDMSDVLDFDGDILRVLEGLGVVE